MADELIEAWDWEKGKPTGVAVSRKEAHLKGIPHEGVHLWIMNRIGNAPHILLQRRAPHKEFYPGYLDITVGGHVLFGQEKEKLQKEAREELGISPREEDLVDLGYFKYEESIPEFSLFHREFQHVWLLFDDRPIDEYRFDDGEVDGIAAVNYPQFKDILSGAESASGYFSEGMAPRKKIFDSSEFHPLFFTGPMVDYMQYLINEIDKRI
jgi:isopentenyl-diphosphate Delta-isomerase